MRSQKKEIRSVKDVLCWKKIDIVKFLSTEFLKIQQEINRASSFKVAYFSYTQCCLIVNCDV